MQLAWILVAVECDIEYTGICIERSPCAMYVCAIRIYVSRGQASIIDIFLVSVTQNMRDEASDELCWFQSRALRVIHVDQV
jgi:hypothetical protein